MKHVRHDGRDLVAAALVLGAMLAAPLLFAGAARAQAPVVNVDLATDRTALASLPPVMLQPGDLTVELWVKGNFTGEKSEPLLGTWDGADDTKGWRLTADRSGAWAWELSSGGQRLEYRPTAKRQGIFDDAWHQIAFSIVGARHEARLYFDGENVAVYSIKDLPEWHTSAAPVLGDGFHGEVGQLRMWIEAVPGRALHGAFLAKRPDRMLFKAHAPPRQEVSVMAWNIWHGGRENGAEAGVAQVIDVIRDSGADIVCMQETYGSGPAIADALGFYFYLRSSNLSIMSRFPIRETFDPFRPFFAGGAIVEPSPGQRLAVFTLWIRHLPDLDAARADPAVTAAKLVEAEGPTRLREATAILADMKRVLDDADRVPVILAGDFNSPSHLDWTEATRERNGGLVVEWPVSKACADAGLVDAFRAVHTDPAAMPGLTWSPRFGYTDRIDYVYCKGAGIRPLRARVIDTHAVRFPSDHAAVVTRLGLRP